MHEKALFCYDKSLELDSEEVNIWNNRGVTLEVLGRFNDALESYDEALKLDSKHSSAGLIKVNCLVR